MCSWELRWRELRRRLEGAACEPCYVTFDLCAPAMLGSMKETGYDLGALMANWRWLIDPSEYVLLAVSPFADLLLQDRSGAICLFDVNAGDILYATELEVDPVRLFPFAFDDRLAARYREAGLFLTDGKCYGYKLPVITAQSSFKPENVYVADLAEYVSFLGDFHQQLQDVEDGEKIRLKVINRPN